MPPLPKATQAARPLIIPWRARKGHAPGEALTVRAEAKFQGRLPAFTEVRTWAEAFGAAVGTDRGAVLRLVLVLEELFTNTVAHGYASAGGSIWVTLASRAGGIEVTYEDAAPEFDPFTPVPGAPARRTLEEAPPGGLGLALVRGLSVSARYARIDGRNRITLTLPPEDTRPAPPAAAG